MFMKEILGILFLPIAILVEYLTGSKLLLWIWFIGAILIVLGSIFLWK